MPIFSTDSLILPDNANVGGAFQQEIKLPTPAPGAFAQYKSDGSTFDIVTIAFCVLTTSATAGNRNMLFIYNDADANSLAQIPAALLQGPTLAITYLSMLNITTPTNPGGGRVIGPLAPVVLMPGWSFTFFIGQGVADDQIQFPTLTLLRFPTGTPASQIQATQAPAPV